MLLSEPNCFLSGLFDEEFFIYSGDTVHSARGIFDEEFSEISDAEGRRITITVAREDGRNLRHGDEISKDQSLWELIGNEPIDDGQYTDLVLREQPDLVTLNLSWPQTSNAIVLL